MIISEMHTGFKLEVDKTSALELPGFEPEEIDFWLDNAIRRYSKLRYDEFEKTQKRIDDIRTLIVHYSDPSAAASDYPNGYKFGLPVEDSGFGDEDYWLTLSEECNIIVSAVETRKGITETS